MLKKPAIQTTSFKGNEFSFEWIFEYTVPDAPCGAFDFEPDPAKHPGGRNSGITVLDFWSPLRGSLVERDNTILTLTAQHRRDPHNDEFDEGGLYEFEREIQFLADAAAFTPVPRADDVLEHTDSEGKHKDRYKLSYKKNGNTVQFKLEGATYRNLLRVCSQAPRWWA